MHSSIHYTYSHTHLGLALIAQQDHAVCAVMFGDDETTLQQTLRDWFPHATYQPLGVSQRDAVVRAITAPHEIHNIPVRMTGTAFQQQVWHALTEIPPGQTLSYSDLAKRLGQSKSTRAIAQACGANRLAVLIPCHRVIGKNKTLTGYRWGVPRKEKLLLMEQHPENQRGMWVA